MAALPMEKAPLKDTPGEKYRQYQYARQLPAHDMDINHCNKLSPAEQEEFAVFQRLRREKALGRGILKEIIQGGEHVSDFTVVDSCTDHLFFFSVLVVSDKWLWGKWLSVLAVLLLMSYGTQPVLSVPLVKSS